MVELLVLLQELSRSLCGCVLDGRWDTRLWQIVVPVVAGVSHAVREACVRRSDGKERRMTMRTCSGFIDNWLLKLDGMQPEEITTL